MCIRTRYRNGKGSCSLTYSYYENKPKQPERIGELWYLYDGNGNVMEERKGGHSEEAISGSGSISREGAATLLDRGIGLTRNETEEEDVYTRRYLWDEENRLKATIDSAGGTVDYRYDAEGMRTSKYSREGETLYFNRMWLMSTDGYEFRRSKNIYLGEVRIATRANNVIIGAKLQEITGMKLQTPA